MAFSNDELMEFARKVYIKGDDLGPIARKHGVDEHELQSDVRSCIPRLISEEGWNIQEALMCLNARDLPIEMRQEVKELKNKHGARATVAWLGLSMGSVQRWSRGEFGEANSLRMGGLPWKRMDDEDHESAEPIEHVDDSSKLHHMSNHSDLAKRYAVYRMLTEDITAMDLGIEYEVSSTTIYMWRQHMVGKLSDPGFDSRCKAFIAKVAAEKGIEPAEFIRPPSKNRTKSMNATRRTGRKRSRRGNLSGKPNRSYSVDMKRTIVNKFVNHKIPLGELVEEYNIPRSNIYAWRLEYLGPVEDPDFQNRARAMAKEFVDSAKVDDIIDANRVNGRQYSGTQEALSFMVPHKFGAPIGSPTSPHATTLAPTPAHGSYVSQDAGVAKLSELDAAIASLQKDRQIMAQDLELQELRRKLQLHERKS